ncbi:hypothetical protein GGTG_11869 [Gaeumannomyces tritici R3-111a-1]|uniref:Uncharacterized protein n=1 Tax=Gaeumannomyces tritici (strain R3-111a-1) TaxID=644352 RepID=J3PED8_GAET3|nr:hypothetical protein GGTG_11869 [Gaeumannomyces tritici R3-111a-1]EJT70846.1 hypothetical protein GGTG_11869 [Gaeumannomyces tritici R3-111a-1]
MDIFWPENREGHEDLVCFGITATNIVPGSYDNCSNGLAHRRVLLRPYDKLYQQWRDRQMQISRQEWDLRAAQEAGGNEFLKHRREWRENLAASRKGLARAQAAQAATNKSDEAEVAAAEAEEERVAEEGREERKRASEEKRRKRAESWERSYQARQERLEAEYSRAEGSGAGGAGARWWAGAGVALATAVVIFVRAW